MDDNPYYDGLSREELVHDSLFIILLETAWYCKSHNKKYIRYNHLRKISNDSLREITNSNTDFGGGNFYRKVKRCELRGFFKVKKVGKKETRIRPNISLIEKEVKHKQIENLRSNDKILYRALKPGDTINRARAMPIESVKVFDRLSIS